MENQPNKLVNYREFFKKELKNSAPAEDGADMPELERGMKLEKEDTGDDALSKEIAMGNLQDDPNFYSKTHGPESEDNLKYDDGSMKIPRVRGMVGLAKIIQVGKPSNGQCANGETSGMTSVVGATQEKITAAGMVDKSVATKSVGGSVAPGEGQKQGGPNSNGKIDSTPREIDTDKNGGQVVNSPHRTGGFKGTPKLNESHTNLIKNLVREVLDEMELGEDKWIQKAVNPAHKGDCTPMSKPSCTPHKKALAKRFKQGLEEETELECPECGSRNINELPADQNPQGGGSAECNDCGETWNTTSEPEDDGQGEGAADAPVTPRGEPSDRGSYKVMAPRQAHVNKDTHSRTVQFDPHMTQ